MAVLKCKMCGGSLEINEGITVCECEYCGTKQTITTANDENIQALFNRANILRMKSEFDKAEALYEKLVQKSPDDAEAHWGLILCKFGIEYVEDPATFKRVPTCHRTSFDSIIADEDYKEALRCADTVQRSIYEAEAKEIDRLQKEILALSAKEEPYDVFICYKESDNGTRTPDSVIANDIYHQLTNEGFKVFYAAITLESKLGSAYEPCIFAALNSAKVMLAIGTKPEYFNAVWVKNEWSRYLKMMKKDRSKLLIPCYKDMDAYELPEEFAHLQAQDMSKIGFINDIVRGIKKVVKKDEPKAQAAKAQPASPVPAGNPTANSLVKRAFIFLEDGDWSSADEYCEKALDIDPENAQAYLGKLMAELEVSHQDALRNVPDAFDDSKNFQKAVRFGSKELRTELLDDIRCIKERNEKARIEGIYTGAVKAMKRAKDESEYKSAASKFKTIPGYKDADTLAEQCLKNAEICHKDDIYNFAISRMNENTVGGYKEAINTFSAISGWRNTDDQIKVCQQRIEEIKAKEEADRLERVRIETERRIAKQKAAKKRKKIAAIVIPVVAVCVAVAILLPTVIIPNIRYSSAVDLYNAGKYEEAITAFTALNGYKDSTEQIKKCEAAIIERNNNAAYNAAVDFYNAGKYEEAITAFKALDGYKDSEAQITKCETAINDVKYNAAVELYNAKKYDDAISAFTTLNGYKDSEAMINEIKPKYYMQLISDASVGSRLFWGSYEQDNNTSNGKEDIEWIVLAREDDRVLVISRYALDCQQYYTSYTSVTWETCSLRKWLNGTFLNAAFSESERAMIPSVTVSADKNPSYSTSPGNSTTDQVFLLSITEANKYFSSNSARQCQGTAYCYAQGVYKASNGNCWWWLRSPSYDSCNAASVGNNGSVLDRGCSVNYSNAAVRPALWIDLEV